MADQIISLYERHAHFWHTLRNERCSLFERPWLDRFLALTPPASTILDLGCGTAEPIAGYLISQGRAVTGIDSSPTLISLCQSRFPQHEWLVSDMRSLHLDPTFSGILAWDSFFHLSPEDQRRMFPIFRAHAAPGTALMFTSGTRAGEVYAEFCGEPLYHGSLDSEEYRSLLHANDFEVVAHVSEDPACGEHTIWLAQSSQ